MASDNRSHEIDVAAPMGAAAPRSPEATDVAVEMSGLTKRFPVRRTWADMLRHPGHRSNLVAVDQVSCSIERGEFFGLLGPNGAGKTTLFKLLSTLILPDEGTARICGVDLRSDPRGVRSFVNPVIADERSLNWRLSATENLCLYATLHGLKDQARERRIGEILEVVGLEDARHKTVGAFSSGMKQRLLLARALLSTPRVLLLDEPTRSLDPISARNFRLFLRNEIVSRQSCTVILATHNTEEALDLCDRVGVLDQGRLVAVGTPAELTHRVAGARYRVWTKTPNHRAFRALDHELGVSRVAQIGDGGDWGIVELTLAADGDASATVLESLIHRGVSVARFERVQLPLADLIEDLLQSSDRAGFDA